MAYFLENYPVSKESASLTLTEEQEKNCRAVYRLSEDESDRGAYFAELWVPDKAYSDEYVILPLRSTGGTVVTLKTKNTLIPVNFFANVIGSKADDLPDGFQYWISFWMSKTKQSYPSCCTDGNFYYTDRNNTEYRFTQINVQKSKVNAACSTGQVNGGHIIINAKAAAEAPKNGTVYIVPLCTNHNIGFADGCGWGAGFYMKLKGDILAVKLKGYLANARNYIEA